MNKKILKCLWGQPVKGRFLIYLIQGIGRIENENISSGF